MELQEALNKLYSLHTLGVKLGLDNVKGFLSHLGNPQRMLKAFHVAGSNGKGSTAAFTASILQEMGFKTGLYTSPHFINFNERVMINRYQVPDEFVRTFISENEKYIDEHRLTFFEVTTALAFQYFYENKVDYAVIETGLGGRLDATNVLESSTAVITSISLEHTAILGSTIEAIAYEKGEIIKRHSKVFTGKLPGEAVNLIEKKCTDTNSTLFRIEDYTIEKENSLTLYTEEIELDDWTMPLRGNYQKYNAALAALAVSKTLDTDDFKKIELGIRNVVKNTGLQGRFEYYRKSPDIIFDSAHNPEGVENFLSEFNKDSGRYGRRVLLFAVMNDKAVGEMLLKLKDSFDEIYITEVHMERSFKIRDLQRLAAELNIMVKPAEDPSAFVRNFAGVDSKHLLVVMGSMYLLGEIKSLLKENKIA